MSSIQSSQREAAMRRAQQDPFDQKLMDAGTVDSVGAAVHASWIKLYRRMQERRADSQARSRALALQGKLGERSDSLLACPVCQERYSFGFDCPGCDVQLVDEAALDAVSPEDAEPSLVQGPWAGVPVLGEMSPSGRVIFIGVALCLFAIVFGGELGVLPIVGLAGVAALVCLKVRSDRGR